jgi:hypothetical protein
MSEVFNYPRYGAYQAALRLKRAEAVINAFSELLGHLVALLGRSNPASKDDDGLTIRHSWLRVSA